MFFDCDCHQTNSNKNTIQQRVRHTNTRSNGCPVSIIAYQSQDRLCWHVKHRPDPKSTTYNHPPSLHPSAHPVHRKLSPQDWEVARGLAQAGNY